jgi:hypothetical protein
MQVQVWEGTDEEQHRLAVLIGAGSQHPDIRESNRDYFTCHDGFFLCCPLGMALVGLHGSAQRAYDTFYGYRRTTPFSAAQRDLANLLQIHPGLAYQIDMRNTHMSAADIVSSLLSNELQPVRAT